MGDRENIVQAGEQRVERLCVLRLRPCRVARRRGRHQSVYFVVDVSEPFKKDHFRICQSLEQHFLPFNKIVSCEIDSRHHKTSVKKTKTNPGQLRDIGHGSPS